MRWKRKSDVCSRSSSTKKSTVAGIVVLDFLQRAQKVMPTNSYLEEGEDVKVSFAGPHLRSLQVSFSSYNSREFDGQGGFAVRGVACCESVFLATVEIAGLLINSAVRILRQERK